MQRIHEFRTAPRVRAGISELQPTILMRHGEDPEEAIVRAVHDTQDNDSIAAIVGAAVGALHGRRAGSRTCPATPPIKTTVRCLP